MQAEGHLTGSVHGNVYGPEQYRTRNERRGRKENVSLQTPGSHVPQCSITNACIVHRSSNGLAAVLGGKNYKTRKSWEPGTFLLSVFFGKLRCPERSACNPVAKRWLQASNTALGTQRYRRDTRGESAQNLLPVSPMRGRVPLGYPFHPTCGWYLGPRRKSFYVYTENVSDLQVWTLVVSEAVIGADGAAQR